MLLDVAEIREEWSREGGSFQMGVREIAFTRVLLGKKTSKFLDLRPTTPKHEMFYHFKSHLSM